MEQLNYQFLIKYYMKIGIVCYPTYGGSGVVATELGIALAEKGHKIHFISYKKPARLNKFFPGIVYHEVTSLDYPLFEYTPYETALASKLVDVIMHEDLDILHVHYAVPHASVAYMAQQIVLSKGKYIPIVTTLHGTDITLVGNDPSYAPVVEFSINHSDGVTAVSKYLKDETERIFNITRDIKVIYNFVDADKFSHKKNADLRKNFASVDEKILVHVSNFRKVKRVQDILYAFQIIRKEIPVKLLMIGDGPERVTLEEICRNNDLCSDVHFLGKQDQIEELLPIADVFLLPSENESFGLAALEAMACEVPVVSSNAGGLPEVNRDGETGFLHNIGDINSMASKTIKLLKDPVLHARMAQNAKAMVDHFSLPTIISEYERFYLTTIEKAKNTESNMLVLKG